MKRIREIEEKSMKKNVPDFGPGDTVRVASKIIEGGKERIQNFEGIVIKRQRGGLRETFVVRRIFQGVGIERTFPIHSPRVAGIEVVKKGKVRRAKLLYLRNRVGDAAVRIKEKKSHNANEAKNAK